MDGLGSLNLCNAKFIPIVRWTNHDSMNQSLTSVAVGFFLQAKPWSSISSIHYAADEICIWYISYTAIYQGFDLYIYVYDLI